MAKEADLSDLQLKVLNLVKLAGWTGKTCDEIEAETGLTHQSASARIHELANWPPNVPKDRKQPLIERRHATRKTRAGRGAAIYVAAGLRQAGKVEGMK